MLYKALSYSQYKIGRGVVSGKTLTSTDAYKDATLTFGKAVTTSRENDTWYQIASTTLANGTKSTDLNGAWVKASNVTNPTADPAATADNSIKVVYQTTNSNPISGADKTFVTNSTKTKANDPYDSAQKNNAGLTLQDFAKNNVPTGYTFKSAQTGAVYGGTYRVTVEEAATSKVSFVNANYNIIQASDFKSGYPTLSTADQQVFTGVKGTPIASTVFAADGSIGKLFVGDALTGPVYTDTTGTTTANITKGYLGQPVSNGRSAVYVYNATKTQGANGGLNYSDDIKLIFDTYYVATPASAAASNSGNADYAN